MNKFYHPYVTIRRITGRKTAHFTTRATLCWSLNEQSTRVAIAVCSPLDQFSRSKGRLISSGRLTSEHSISISARLETNRQLVEYLDKHPELYKSLNDALCNIQIPETASTETTSSNNLMSNYNGTY